VFFGLEARVFGGVARVLRVCDAQIAEDVLGSQGKACPFLIRNYEEVVCFWVYLFHCAFSWVNLTHDCVHFQWEVIFIDLFSHFIEDVILDLDGLNRFVE
jgi:hypothetical protein